MIKTAHRSRPTWRCLILLTFSISVAVAGSPAPAEPLRVVDSAGRKVVLDKPAARVIALAPHLVENVFSAGAGDKLVGVVSYSDYPPAAREIPIVGGYHAFSREKIVALKPDLILTWAEGDGFAAASPFEKLGIPVYVDEPRELEDVAASVRNIGLLTGTGAAADRAASAFLRELTTLQQRYRDARMISVFYQVWNEPLQTVNEQHIISAVIELCGGRNVFTDTAVIAPKISLEAVLTRDPDVIVASGMDEARPEWLDAWRAYSQLRAVKNDNLYFIPPDILQRHTFRILQGTAQMCENLQRARQKIADSATLPTP